MVVSLKILLLAVFFVTSGGIFFPHKFKRNKILVFSAGIIGVLGTAYLGLDIYRDVISEIKRENSEEKYNNKNVEFYDFADMAGLLASRATGSGPFISWEELKKLSIYFKWNSTYINSDSLTENYVFRGEIYLRFNGAPDIDQVTGKPQPWQVSAYGLSHHAASGVAFTRGIYNSEPLFERFKNDLRASFLQAGYRIREFGECQLMQSLDAYYVAINDKEFLLSLSFDGGSAGLVPTISLYFPKIDSINKTDMSIFRDIRINCN